MGHQEEFSYGEGKRQAEAVLFKEASFPVVAVRFPIVMGEDDYTRRLHFHVEHILQNQPITLPNIDAKMSYITDRKPLNFYTLRALLLLRDHTMLPHQGHISQRSNCAN